MRGHKDMGKEGVREKREAEMMGRQWERKVVTEMMETTEGERRDLNRHSVKSYVIAY